MQRLVQGRRFRGLEADAKVAFAHALHLGLFVRMPINPELGEWLEWFWLSLLDGAAVAADLWARYNDSSARSAHQRRVRHD
jgi:hypothetical protein